MSRLAPDKEDQATEFCSIAVQLLIAQCTCTRINRLMQHRGATSGRMDGMVGIHGAPYCADNISLLRLQGMSQKSGARRNWTLGEEVSFMFKFFVCLRIHYWQKAV